MDDSVNEPSADPALSRPRQAGSDLTKRTFSGFIWMFSGAGAEAVIRVIVLAILARLVTPEEFGIVAAALTVVAFAEIFGRVGIAPSVVQVETLRPEHVRSAFTFTVFLGLCVAAGCYVGAPVIASLYAMPNLDAFVRVISVIFVIRSLMLVSEALLMRQLKFRALAMASLVSYGLGYAAVAVVLAAMGWGAWALVYGQIVQAAVLTVILLLLARHSFKPSLDWHSIKHMGRFGSGITLTQVANYLALNADYFVIGRFIGAGALGHYSRAYVLLSQINGMVGKMGDRVLFPAISAVQSDPARVSRSFHRAVSLSFLTMTPLSVLMIVAAPEIIDLLLGPQWEAVILPFQVLIAGLGFRAAYKFVGTVMRAKGYVFLNAYWQFIYAGLVIATSLVGVQFGIAGVAVGVTLSIVATFASGVFFLRKLIPLTMGDLLGSALRTLAFCAILAPLLASVRLLLISEGVHAGVVVLTLGAIYGGLFSIPLLFLPKVLGPHGAWLGDSLRNLVLSRFLRPTAGTPT